MKLRNSLLAATLLGIGINAANAASYEITVTNTLQDELLAPILVVPVSNDALIFDGHYVTAEAEAQILTGDPAMLAGKIGDDATVAHGADGPPGVLLAAGKSLSFTIDTEASAVRIISMVAPTKVPDNFVSAVVNLDAPLEVALNRYDIGHNEGSKMITSISGSGASVSIKPHTEN